MAGGAPDGDPGLCFRGLLRLQNATQLLLLSSRWWYCQGHVNHGTINIFQWPRPFIYAKPHFPPEAKCLSAVGHQMDCDRVMLARYPACKTQPESLATPLDSARAIHGVAGCILLSVDDDTKPVTTPGLRLL